MKKILSTAIAALLVLTAAFSALAAAPTDLKVEYDGGGWVKVDFLRNVQYSSPSVTVRDLFGTEISAVIIELDDDDLTFLAGSVLPDAVYTFEISGIREGRSGDFGTITGEFSTAGDLAPTIRKVEYDREDRELDIEFVGRVRFQEPVVTVSDAAGNIYSSVITDIDGDGLEVRVTGLTYGNAYTVSVSGVRLADAAPTAAPTLAPDGAWVTPEPVPVPEFTTASFEFQAVDR